ncbi:MAG TPA: hypothetical protein VNO34_08905 [Actinomycetota bacterium]|nr:hypothetical protein [Actinomycetota bacterium]
MRRYPQPAPGDYLDVMGERLSAEELDRLLEADPQGLPAGGAAAAVAAAVAEVRGAFLQPVRPEVAARHLAAMAAALEDGLWGGVPIRRFRVFTVRRAAAIGIAAALTASAAMATTGTLPGPAQDFAARVANHVGIHLPEAAEHGKAVSEVATDPSLKGCDKARAVVEVAVPAWARSNAAEALEKCGEGAGTEGAGDTGGPPEGVPPSTPAGGPPQEVPAGPPEGVPPGPPEGVPSGPPESAPTGGGGPGKGWPPQSVPPVSTPTSSGGAGGGPPSSLPTP